MDCPDADPAALSRALEELAGINRWLGGCWSARRALTAAWPCSGARGAVVLDIATGGGDIARAIAKRYRDRGVHVVALDLHPVTLAYARRHTSSAAPLAFMQADALALPVRERSVDVALCSLAAHHFGEVDLIRLLSEMRRVARGAVVLVDLRRSPVAWLLIRLLTRVIWRSPIVRHDGPVSVRRAYTPGELARAARRAGLIGARVVRQPLFRMALVWRIEEGGACTRRKTAS